MIMILLCIDLILLIKNLDVFTSGGVPMDFYSLHDMSFLEDVISIVDSLQSLQYLDVPRCSYKTIPNI